MTAPADAKARVDHPAVELMGICKRFGPVVALEDIDLTLRPAEVHALLGENGAGKTTLMNVLAGLYQADAGEIRIQGNLVDLRSPRDAVAHNIGMVHQHFELVQDFSGLDNIVLGAEKATFVSDAAGHKARIAKLCDRYGFHIDLQRRVADLEVGNQQKVEILRVLYRGADVLVLDEPTTHLTPDEVDKLFASVRRLAADGVAVVLIAHKVREVMSIADRATVLRRGRLVATRPVAEVTPEQIVALVIGAEAPAASDADVIQAAERRILEQREEDAVLRAGRTDAALLSITCKKSRPAKPGELELRDLSLEVFPGEIHGIAGVAGNGQRELMELIAGFSRVDDGKIILGGTDVTRASTRQRLMRGLALLPDDRIRDGILPAAPVHATYVLGLHRLPLMEKWNLRRRREMTREMIERFNVAAPNEDVPTGNLSGGNIQKVLVARALQVVAAQEEGGVLVAMNPVNGLDVGATGFVHEQIVNLRQSGRGVLLISEDLDELIQYSDRISVLEGGTIAGTLARAEFDKTTIGSLMVAGRE